MVYMSELHKVFKSVKKRSAMFENNLIEQNGPNRKKYSMNIARKVRNDIISLNKMVQTGKNVQWGELWKLKEINIWML